MLFRRKTPANPSLPQKERSSDSSAERLAANNDGSHGAAVSFCTSTEPDLEAKISELQRELHQARLELRSFRKRSATASTTAEDPPCSALQRGDSSCNSVDKQNEKSTGDARDDSDRTKAYALSLEKKGYLFKWQDRSIGWGGTKWSLRFVTLERGRISYYGSHHDPGTTSPRYVLNLRGCAVRDEGWKRNKRHRSTKTSVTDHKEPPLDESGAYFFLFSIYLRRDHEDPRSSSIKPSANPSVDDVVPLLRFSTPTQADKQRWIQLISEACAYCETDEYLEEEARIYNEDRKRQEQQLEMALAMPEAKNNGTLPPLYFAPAVERRRPARRPSFSKISLDATRFRSTNSIPNAEKVESRSTKGYPPSKPMHRSAAPSYLSIEAPAQNYRGLFNLGIIVLIVSNFRLMLATVQMHGFVVMNLFDYLSKLPEAIRNRDRWQEFPFLSALTLQLVFVVTAFALEWLMSRNKLPNAIGMTLHYINAHSALIVPMAIVWNFINIPAIGAIVLLHATITWMKLVSYAHANEDYRRSCQDVVNGVDSHHATLALLENIEEHDAEIQYPQNVTLQNLMYFWCAPTLTYQIAFPKYPRVRLWRVAGILARLMVAVAIFAFLGAQFVTPTLQSLVAELETTNGRLTVQILAEYWLRLSVTNTYMWLLMFYSYFHLFLNLTAEVLRFGDRVFYKDWWNSSEVSSYWRLWNLPVHFWLIRHVYFPCIRLNIPRQMATLVVFLLSAILHEALVSIPFHMVRPWSFLGMMMQVPLVALTKFLHRRQPGTSVGNLIFWVSFCVVGQPMAILLYTVDYQYSQQVANECAYSATDGSCPSALS